MVRMSHTNFKFKFIIWLYDKSFYPDYLFRREVKIYTSGTIIHLSVADYREESEIRDTLDTQGQAGSISRLRYGRSEIVKFDMFVRK